jgi:nicotinate-nucleotide pyrophosphorylase (carboxylating)
MIDEIDPDYLRDLVKRALVEDCGNAGDITSRAIFDNGQSGSAIIESKEDGILSGSYILEPVFNYLDPSITLDKMINDGNKLHRGAIICRLRGSLLGILAGERVALNFLQHLSGIATAAHSLASAIAHTKAKLLDTRKTTPTLRLLEKRAVLDGGGVNHRFGLFDMILIKDTHVKAAGGVAPAIEKARVAAAQMKKSVKIEAEVQTWEEFLDALRLVPDRIMLDNMSLELMSACVRRARQEAPGVELEASGNINARNIALTAETGVDFVSSGAITHSVKAMDIHLVVE